MNKKPDTEENLPALPSRSRLWSAALLTLREWFGGLLLGMAVGIELDILLTKKLGWVPEDSKAHFLSAVLLFGSAILVGLKLTKKSGG
jgi:hypothetical protein